ncbi:MAG: FAD-dependent oxidoreductase [Conexivisphaerales archaeon]
MSNTADYDVIIVGAGITGLMIAYHLLSKGLRIAVVEKEDFAGRGVTSRQSEVIHVIQLPFSSLKSKLARKGNKMYDNICKELSVELRRTKAILVVESNLKLLLLFVGYLYLRAELGKDFRVEIRRSKGLKEVEPLISDRVKAGIVVDGYGILDSASLVRNMVEHLKEKGVTFYFNCLATGGGLDADQERTLHVDTTLGRFRSRAVVIAAGLYSDEVAARFGIDVEKVTPGKGVIAEFAGLDVRNIIAPFSLIQRGRTKGGGIIPTVRGTCTFGPTLRIAKSKEDYEVDSEDIDQLIKKFSWLLSREGKLIKAFAGIRPLSPSEDFIIHFPAKYEGRVAVQNGIESPGLTAAPAIAEMVCSRLKHG